MRWLSFSDFKFIKAVKSYSAVSLACVIWYATLKMPNLLLIYLFVLSF